jgi:hypothetical protein
MIGARRANAGSSRATVTEDQPSTARPHVRRCALAPRAPSVLAGTPAVAQAIIDAADDQRISRISDVSF